MKKILLLTTLAILTLTSASAAGQGSVSGRVADPKGAPVTFATAILLQNNDQIAGAVTDTDGKFSLSARGGKYTLTIQIIGYNTLTREIMVEGNTDLGDIELQPSEVEIEAVEVTSKLITRKADRFVVDVANSNQAIGKTGEELLKLAPGVWVVNDEISINGASGTKVYINDRQVRESGADLLAYLRTIQADEIQRIEVIPISGADYDADSKGGIIKITLKRSRNAGLTGTANIRGTFNEYGSYSVTPNVKINYNKGKLNLNAMVYAGPTSDIAESDEVTNYKHSADTIRAHSDMPSDLYAEFGGRIGAVYDITDRHSIGAEFAYDGQSDYNSHTNSQTDIIRGGIPSASNTSLYDSRQGFGRSSATLNYIFRTDTLGSTLKIIGDYTFRTRPTRSTYNIHSIEAGLASDTTYTNDAASEFSVAVASADFEKVFSPKVTMKVGLKYTRNDVYTNSVYTSGNNTTLSQYNRKARYNENIPAVYASANATLGRWGLAGGLRAEYTYSPTSGEYKGQNYASLFPNLNVSYGLKADGSYSLIAQYSRSITRPNFWALDPTRVQISDFTYQDGNPDLKPTITNRVSLTAVMAYKYTVTIGASLSKNDINMDAEANGDEIRYSFYNYGKVNKYYITANLPVSPAKWCNINVQLTDCYYGQVRDKNKALSYSNMFNGSISTDFTLPKRWIIEASYNYMSSVVMGTLSMEPTHDIGVSLKKLMLDDRLTITLSGSNLLNQAQRTSVNNADFSRHTVIRQMWNSRKWTASISYKFNSGKQFRSRGVESAAAEATSRM